jgi:hypothetical protein
MPQISCSTASAALLFGCLELTQGRGFLLKTKVFRAAGGLPFGARASGHGRRNRLDSHLCVVVKILIDDAFVVTAYLTDRVKKGTLLWPKKS